MEVQCPWRRMQHLSRTPNGDTNYNEFVVVDMELRSSLSTCTGEDRHTGPRARGWRPEVGLVKKAPEKDEGVYACGGPGSAISQHYEHSCFCSHAAFGRASLLAIGARSVR